MTPLRLVLSGAAAQPPPILGIRDIWLSLTQKPMSLHHRLPLTAFETHNGRSTFAAGTALHVKGFRTPARH